MKSARITFSVEFVRLRKARGSSKGVEGGKQLPPGTAAKGVV